MARSRTRNEATGKGKSDSFAKMMTGVAGELKIEDAEKDGGDDGDVGMKKDVIEK